MRMSASTISSITQSLATRLRMLTVASGLFAGARATALPSALPRVHVVRWRMRADAGITVMRMPVCACT